MNKNDTLRWHVLDRQNLNINRQFKSIILLKCFPYYGLKSLIVASLTLFWRYIIFYGIFLLNDGDWSIEIEILVMLFYYIFISLNNKQKRFYIFIFVEIIRLLFEKLNYKNTYYDCFVWNNKFIASTIITKYLAKNDQHISYWNILISKSYCLVNFFNGTYINRVLNII